MSRHPVLSTTESHRIQPWEGVKITDPTLIADLNARNGIEPPPQGQKITDPAIIAELNARNGITVDIHEPNVKKSDKEEASLISEAGKALARGVLRLPERAIGAPAQYIGGVTGITALEDFGRHVRAKAEELVNTPGLRPSSLITDPNVPFYNPVKLTGAVMEALPDLVALSLIPGGLIAGGALKSGMTAGRAAFLASSATGAVFGLSNAGDTYDDQISHGVPKDVALWNASKSGALEAALEFGPELLLFKRILKGARPPEGDVTKALTKIEHVARASRAAGSQGLFEGLTEAAQTVKDNYFGREYDPERSLTQGAELSASVGGILGVVSGAGGQVYSDIAAAKKQVAPIAPILKDQENQKQAEAGPIPHADEPTHQPTDGIDGGKASEPNKKPRGHAKTPDTATVPPEAQLTPTDTANAPEEPVVEPPVTEDTMPVVDDKPQSKPRQKQVPGKITAPSGFIKPVPLNKTHLAINSKKNHAGLLNMKVEGGRAISTNMDVTLEKNTDMDDGIYHLVGDDLMPNVGAEASSFPDTPVMENAIPIGSVGRGELLVNLARAAKSASKENYRASMNGVLLQVVKDGIRLTGTDGAVMSVNNIPGDYRSSSFVGKSVLLRDPNVISKALQGLEGDSFSIDTSDRYVRFTGSDGSVTARIDTATYPDIDLFYMGQTFNKQYAFPAKALSDAVKAMKGHEKDGMVKVTWGDDSVSIESHVTGKKVVIPAVVRQVTHAKGVVPGTVSIATEKKDEGAKLSILSSIANSVRGDMIHLTRGDRNARDGMDDSGYVYYHAFGRDVFQEGTAPSGVQSEQKATKNAYKKNKSVKGYRTGGEYDISGDEYKRPESEKRVAKKEAQKAVPPHHPHSNRESFKRPFIRGVPKPETLHKTDLPEILKFLPIGNVKIAMRKALRGNAGLRGYFKGKGSDMNIALRADIFKDTQRAIQTVAHEIFHFIDYFPDQTLSRGNILGHIASLKKYMKHTIGLGPDNSAITPLSKDDKARIRDEVNKIIEFESMAESERNAALLAQQQNLDITSDQVKAIFNDMQGSEKYPGVSAFISGLSDEEKVSIVKEAMKGMMSEATRARFKEIAGKEALERPRFTDWDAKTKEYFNAFVRDEMLKRGQFRRDIIMGELKALTHLIPGKAFDEKENTLYTLYRHNPSELYADAGSLMITNPKMVYDIAPEFYHAWFQYLPNKPEVKAVWDHIQNMARTEGMSEKALDDDIQSSMKGSNAQFYKDNEPTISRIRNMWEDFLSVFVDVTQPLRERYKKAGAPIGRDALYKLEEFPYRYSTHLNFFIEMKTSVLDKMKAFGIKQERLSSFLFYRRVIESEADKANPWGVTQERAKKQLDMIRKNDPSLYERLTDLEARFSNIWQKTVVAPYLASGMAGQKLEAILKERHSYVTFLSQHILENQNDDTPHESFGFIHARVGTLNPITDTLTATVLKGSSLLSAVAKNNHTMHVFKMLESMPKDIRGIYADPDIEFDPIRKALVPKKNQSKKGRLVSYLENGKVKHKIIDEIIAKALDSNPSILPEGGRAFIRALNTPFKMLFTTLRPGYLAFNLFFRDPRSFVLNVPGNIASTPRKISAWKRAWKHAFAFADNIPDEVVSEMLKGNSMISTMKRPNEAIDDTTYLEQMMMDIGFDRPQGGFFSDKLKKRVPAVGKVADALDLFDKMTGIAAIRHQYMRVATAQEAVGRIATKIYLDEHYPNMSSEEKNHWIRTGSSPAFLRRGTGATPMELFFLFYNANKEGWRTSFEAIKDPRYRKDYIQKMIVLGLPSAMLKWAGIAGILAAFGIGSKEYWEMIDEHDIENYDILPTGMILDIEQDGKKSIKKALYFRIPKSEAERAIWGILTTAAMKDIYDAPKVLLEYLGGQVPGTNPIIDMGKGLNDYLLDRQIFDDFRGRTVFTQREMEENGPRKRKKFMKYILDKAGLDYIFKIKIKTPDEIPSKVEELFELPIGSGDLIHRFLRVSDVGLTQKAKREQSDIRHRNARMALDAIDSLRNMLHKDTTAEEKREARARLIALLKEEAMRGEDGISKLIHKAAKDRAEEGYSDPLLKAIDTVGRSNSEKLELFRRMTEREDVTK